MAQPVEGREPKQIEPGKRWYGPGGAYSSRVSGGDMSKASDYLHRAGYLPGGSLDEVIKARVHSGYYRRRLAAENHCRGVAQSAERRVHTPEAVGSSPAPATRRRVL